MDCVDDPTPLLSSYLMYSCAMMLCSNNAVHTLVTELRCCLSGVHPTFATVAILQSILVFSFALYSGVNPGVSTRSIGGATESRTWRAMWACLFLLVKSVYHRSCGIPIGSPKLCRTVCLVCRLFAILARGMIYAFGCHGTRSRNTDIR